MLVGVWCGVMNPHRAAATSCGRKARTHLPGRRPPIAAEPTNEGMGIGCGRFPGEVSPRRVLRG